MREREREREREEEGNEVRIVARTVIARSRGGLDAISAKYVPSAVAVQR
jgi:hypothetical protein